MTTIKFINYFNLVIGIVLLGTHLISIPVFYDYSFMAGMVLIIWYNWETLKRLKGERNKLNQITFVVGVLTIVFAVGLILSSIALINEGLKNAKTQVVMGAIYIPVGLTTIFLSVNTLKLYKEV
jgi:hypothetical protein